MAKYKDNLFKSTSGARCIRNIVVCDQPKCVFYFVADDLCLEPLMRATAICFKARALEISRGRSRIIILLSVDFDGGPRNTSHLKQYFRPARFPNSGALQSVCCWSSAEYCEGRPQNSIRLSGDYAVYDPQTNIYHFRARDPHSIRMFNLNMGRYSSFSTCVTLILNLNYRKSTECYRRGAQSRN